MAFLTIHARPEANAAQRRAASRYGPRMVNSPADYATLLERAGFGKVRAIDLTREYLHISMRWDRARARHVEELRAQLGEARVREMTAEGRANLEGIRRGVLQRSLFVAVNSR